MLLDLVLQPNPLKFGSRKFNVIINIIDITLGLGVATKSKNLKYNFIEKSNIFRSYFLKKYKK